MTLADLKPYASPAQRRYIEAIEKCGSAPKAARQEGVNVRTVERAIEAVKRKAAAQGYAPDHDMTHAVPEGFKLKGTSTLYGPDGEMTAQWVKSEADRTQQEAHMREAADALSSTLKREKPIKQKARTDSDLLNLYPIADYHLGMLSWAEETGADWDVQIAEDTLFSWFAEAIARSPDAAVGLLGILGDFAHWDGMDAVTPEHHNLLDADTRFAKLVRVTIRVLRRVVRMLLEKHAKVHIIIAEGNHDPASSVWLREWFAALYENEPRVTVDQSPDPYYCYEFGRTALFVHHGHKRKPENVADVFAAKFRETFGRSKYAYAHLGHKHEAKLVETPLMVLEQHRTLSAPDAYATRGGWLSGRGASVITYSKEYGEVGRVTIGPEMCRT